MVYSYAMGILEEAQAEIMAALALEEAAEGVKPKEPEELLDAESSKGEGFRPPKPDAMAELDDLDSLFGSSVDAPTIAQDDAMAMLRKIVPRHEVEASRLGSSTEEFALGVDSDDARIDEEPLSKAPPPIELEVRLEGGSKLEGGLGSGIDSELIATAKARFDHLPLGDQAKVLLAIFGQHDQVEETENNIDTSNLQDHPYANIFPLLDEAKLQELAENIKTVKQTFPILIYEGKILDGRNRYRACKIAGEPPIVKKWEGTPDEARDFVISANLHRRHLTDQERAFASSQDKDSRTGKHGDLESIHRGQG